MAMCGYKYVLDKHSQVKGWWGLGERGRGSGTDSGIYKRGALYWRGDGEQPRSLAGPGHRPRWGGSGGEGEGGVLLKLLGFRNLRSL